MTRGSGPKKRTNSVYWRGTNSENKGTVTRARRDEHGCHDGGRGESTARVAIRIPPSCLPQPFVVFSLATVWCAGRASYLRQKPFGGKTLGSVHSGKARSGRQPHQPRQEPRLRAQ